MRAVGAVLCLTQINGLVILRPATRDSHITNREVRIDPARNTAHDDA